MGEILRDPLWQFIGALLAVLGIVVTLLLVRRKRLSYHVQARTSVVTVRRDLGDRLKILFDGEPVTKIDLFVISILNHGNVPIVPGDFVTPLQVALGSKGDILVADVTDVSPNNLEPVTHVSGNKVTIDPLLLNPQDRVELTVMVSDCEGEV